MDNRIRYLHRLLYVGVLVVGLGLGTGAGAAPLRLGFICDQLPPSGTEALAAAELARRAGDVTMLTAAASGRFSNAAGGVVNLSDYAVLWYHQGDRTHLADALCAGPSRNALRGYVADGGGLFLSGAALAMVCRLGLEPVAPRMGGPGRDKTPAMLTPLAAKHPLFVGLSATDGRVFVCDAGYPAFADFYGTDGPQGGALLARTGATENALVEYAFGKGRVIAMGWRLPFYSHTENRYRANLERLTVNALAYLGDRRSWQPVAVTAGRRAAPDAPVSAGQRETLRSAIADLTASFGVRYPRGHEFQRRLDDLESSDRSGFETLRREALLANPLLDFDRLLLIRRGAGNLGLPANWESNSSLRQTGYDNEICELSPVSPEGRLRTIFRPPNGKFVGDLDLHWDARRMLFSMPGEGGRWQVWEIAADGTGLRQLPLIREPDVDNYDACYLPDDAVIFTSTAPFVGVPCVKGSSHVATLFRYDPGDGRIRQLGFDQDHNWCPTVMPTGRVLYLRWEYSDIPHFVSRILFQCNPDGTGQAAFYGSNSYWPNSMFYARPLPGSPTRFVAVVSGHHDTRRMGELVLFDAEQGRFEADGVVQRICGGNRGRDVEPVIRDRLVSDSWPKYLHPFPLGEPDTGLGVGKYFLVSAQPRGRPWGVYLVDVFDNMLLLAESPGDALLEPVPLRPRPRPPVVPSRVDLGSTEGLLYLTDVYRGPGMAGVPRGTVHALRLISYHFAYHGMGGQVNRVGMDGPWDIKEVLGTVPVETDGSALFRVPANTPVAIQPLDADGCAVQLMRSWATVMPGETRSCAGCHEPTSRTPEAAVTLAARKPPTAIMPWYGPARGFSFLREVQPVLDRYCVSCHNGAPREDHRKLPVFTADRDPVRTGSGGYKAGSAFPPSYLALRRYVRTPTIESDIHLLPPYEFHAGTTELVQRLRKGHHGVRLDREAWDRLITWIDLHAPAHGTWQEIVGKGPVSNQEQRRRAMRRLYAGQSDDPERVVATVGLTAPALPRRTPPPRPAPVQAEGWPWAADEAHRRQAAAGPVERRIELAKGIPLALVRIPAGQFVMGDVTGEADEFPQTVQTMEQPFWMGRFEVSNRQFACFDPDHDSRLENGDFLQFSVRERGYPLNEPEQPVARVSWRQAKDFCRWLSRRTGEHFDLPTEAQWEYACRAGTASSMWFGSVTEDFGRTANLADASLQRIDRFGWGLPVGAVPPWRPAIAGVDDGHRVASSVSSGAPNPWGLHHMHGNAAEWTRSVYRTYPYRADDGRNAEETAGRRVVRGGSWYDRPERATSAFRRAYYPWQRVYNVGFRVVMTASGTRVAAASGP